MKVITRFAPSPTGMLHIGGARTALFNYLFARHHDGEFRLRIEDTDEARNSAAAYQAIVDGLNWLGLSYDGDIVYQSKNSARHRAVAEELVKRGAAYYCYTTPDELAEQRAAAEAKGDAFRYDRKWRPEASTNEVPTPPAGVTPSIRIKAPLDGEVTVRDAVQGDVRFGPEALDDFVILRSDGNPTYNLAVVVDDHDMAVTHVIRGDDHLNNAGRQSLIYTAMGWALPVFAHIPLIHGPDGAKLSKRHGATSTTEYAGMGYLPDAMRNYLARLGWSHGDDEIFDDAQAIAWFGLDHIGQSPARLDFAKLNHVNAHYLRATPNMELAALIGPMLHATFEQQTLLANAMDCLKPRAHTLVDLTAAARFYITPPLPPFDEKSEAILANGGRDLLAQLIPVLHQLPDWNHDAIMEAAKNFGTGIGKKLGDVMQPVRVAITGSTASPSMFEALALFGRDESINRLNAAL